jgi:Immunoglobulin domain/Immunoglobulin I-set domain
MEAYMKRICSRLGFLSFALTWTIGHAVVAQTPQFIVQPVELSVCLGDVASFTVDISFDANSENSSVQWQLDGQPINDNDLGGRVDVTTDFTNLASVTSTLTISDLQSTDAGTFRCMADTTNLGGSTSTAAPLTVFTAPTVAPETVDYTGACVGDAVQLMANESAGSTETPLVIWSIDSGPSTSPLQFQPNPVTANPTFVPAASNVGQPYVLRATVFDCNTKASDTIVVQSFPPLDALPTPQNSETCVGVPVSLAANPSGGDGDYLYDWTVTPSNLNAFFLPSASAADPTFTALVTPPTDSYTVSVTVSSPVDGPTICAASSPASIVVTTQQQLDVQPIPAANVETCVNDSFDLSVDVSPPDGNFSYIWTIDSGPDPDFAQLTNLDSDATSFQPTLPTQPGQPYLVSVVVSGGSCQPQVAQFQITVFDAPSAEPTSPLSRVCAGSSMQLFANPTGSGNQGFLWTFESGPNTDASQFDPFPTVQDPVFTPTTSPSEGDAPYSLRVTVFDPVCEQDGTGSIELTVDPPLSAQPIPDDATTCVGSGVQLDAQPSGGAGTYNFEWFIESSPVGGEVDPFTPTASVQDPVFTPSIAGVYTLRANIDADGCETFETEPITITAVSDVTVTAQSTPSAVCLGGAVLLTADSSGGGQSFLWSVDSEQSAGGGVFSDPNGQTTIFTPDAVGQYVIDVAVDQGQCGNSTDSVSLTVHDAATSDASIVQNVLCLGDTTELTVNTAGSGSNNQVVIWSVESGPDTDAAQLSSQFATMTDFTPSATTSGGALYQVRVDVFDAVCGTNLNDSFDVTVHDALTAAPAADVTLACENESLTLAANPSGGAGDYSYNWSIAAGPADPPGILVDANTDTPTFTPTNGPATYTLALVLGDSVCDPDAPAYFLPVDVASALAVDPAAEFPDAVVNEPLTVLANAVGGTAPTYTWSVLSFPPDCTDGPTVLVPIDDSPDAILTPGCVGQYTLSLVAVDPLCPNASISLNIDVLNIAAAPTADPSAICFDPESGSSAATLSPGISDDDQTTYQFTYQWSITTGPSLSPTQLDAPNTANPVLTPDSAGLYTLSVTIVSDSLPTITADVQVESSNVPPTIDTQPTSRQVCAGEPAVFSVNATGTDLTFAWTKDGQPIDDATENTLTFQQTQISDNGTYTCMVSNGCGTESSDPVTLTVDPEDTDILFASARENDDLMAIDILGCTVTTDLSVVGPMTATPSAIVRVTGLAIHPTTADLYAAVRLAGTPDVPEQETHLARINPATGSATLIGSMSRPIGDIAFHPSGTLYAIRGNNPCPNCSQAGEFGEVYTVDLTDATLTTLSPSLVFGELEGHTIAFDVDQMLYHHGRNPGVFSRIQRVDPTQNPFQIETVTDLPGDVSFSAMTFRNDVLYAARRTAPGGLWTFDTANFDSTIVGPFDPPPSGSVTVTGLVFLSHCPADLACDGLVDLADYQSFIDCRTGPDVTIVDGTCRAFDVDFDDDVDLVDWAALQRLFDPDSGAGG